MRVSECTVPLPVADRVQFRVVDYEDRSGTWRVVLEDDSHVIFMYDAVYHDTTVLTHSTVHTVRGRARDMHDSRISPISALFYLSS